LAALPDFPAGDPSLVRAMTDEIVRREVWLIFHADLKGPAPVRLIAECLREPLSRQPNMYETAGL
jgi:hypothetical protein